VFGLIWGWWLLDETISHLMLSGAVIILLGVMLTSGGLDRAWQWLRAK
jgi:drug/metabolite transporter (DMT)-like permease